MVFSATVNNISVIPWWSVLLVKKTRVPGEYYRPVAQVTDKLYHIKVASSTFRHKWDWNSQL